ncbi:MAG: DnaJ domain-containing protein, partial [Firmicutes bacterium]|nr:DnaJ domain-containing protein [Bacillota bacterium]
MNKFTDYYKVLQVHYEADSKMIESAYKCLCKQYHPDINTAA